MKENEIIRQFNENASQHQIIMEKLEFFSEKLEEVKLALAELPDKIFERADKRYASKLAEKVIYGMVGIIITAFVVALWELIKGEI